MLRAIRRAEDRTVPSVIFALVAIGFGYLSIRWLKTWMLGGGFDSGMIGNVIWRVASGMDSRSAMTGGFYFSTHFSPILFLFVPIFRWAPSLGMPALYLAQVASVVLVGWAGYTVARFRRLAANTRRWLLAAFFISPAALLATQFEFNETTLGLGPLAMVMALVIRGAGRSRIVPWVILAASCRLEMAAAVVMAGIIVWSYGRVAQGRLVVALAGPILAGYVVWLFVNPYDTTSVAAHFSHLGSGPGEVVKTALLKPWRVLLPVFNPQLLISLLFWLLPFGVLAPLSRPRWLLVALPTTGVAIFGVWEPADVLIAHYWYPLLAVGAVVTPLVVTPDSWLGSRLPLLLGAGAVVGWFVLSPFYPFILNAEPLSAGDRELVKVVRDLDPYFVSAPASLLGSLIEIPFIAPYPRPFACAEEALGPYTAPDRPPDVIVIPTEWQQMDGPEGDAFAELLTSYGEVAGTDRFEVWNVADAAGSQRDYRPCSADTFTLK